MIIAVDIGNTSIKIGLFTDGLTDRTALITDPLKERPFYMELLRGIIRGRPVSGSIVSSVVPSLNRTITDVLSNLGSCRPLMVDCKIRTGLKYLIEEPGRIGADRIANAVAAYDMIKGNVIVVDCGSATTLTVVNERANLLGGAIMPGMEMMCTCLKRETGELPLVTLEIPSGALGNDTKSSIISGVLYGSAGAVERLAAEITGTIGPSEVVLTGGNATYIKDLLRGNVHHVPDLTLSGLRLIYERNINE